MMGVPAEAGRRMAPPLGAPREVPLAAQLEGWILGLALQLALVLQMAL